MPQGYLDDKIVQLPGSVPASGAPPAAPGPGAPDASAPPPTDFGPRLDPTVVHDLPPAVATPSSPAQQLKPDDLLGFEKGFADIGMKAQKAVEGALGTIPGMSQVGQSMGLPSTDQLAASQQADIATAAKAGRRPGRLGEFVGGIAGNPLSYVGGPEAGVGLNAAIGAGSGALSSDAKTPGQLAVDTVLGGAFGAAAKPVGAALGKVAGPVLSDLQSAALRHGGWQPSPGQAIGGFQKGVEGLTKNVLPWVGSAVNRSADTWEAAKQAILPKVLSKASVAPDADFAQAVRDTVMPAMSGLGKSGKKVVTDAWGNLQSELGAGLSGSETTSFFNNAQKQIDSLWAIAASPTKPVVARNAANAAGVLTQGKELLLDAAERQNPGLAAAIRAGRSAPAAAALDRASPPTAKGLGTLTGLGLAGMTGQHLMEPVLGLLNHIPGAEHLGKLLEYGGMGAAAGASTVPYNRAVQSGIRAWADTGNVPGRTMLAKGLRQLAPRATVGAAGAVAPTVRRATAGPPPQ